MSIVFCAGVVRNSIGARVLWSLVCCAVDGRVNAHGSRPGVYSVLQGVLGEVCVYRLCKLLYETIVCFLVETHGVC